ncbi:family 43 glycosylhydrolase [Novosphingobium flavum]|uniref:family 43 glycosylhydrolase n=1 Tax=Novosphingobium flavum TaxID=1778672 RepID=UPI001C8BBF52
MRESSLARRAVLAGGSAAAATLLGPSPLLAGGRPRTIHPGQVWRDTAGKPIQAHGASIIQVGDVFYWYGENKERTLPGSGIWHWGVRAYASRDLVNWTDQGLIIPPVTDDPKSPLHPSRQLDRPHILYNPVTRKFVCWVKIMEADGRQTRTVLTADRMTGPYTIIRQDMLPLGMSAGDFDLVVSPADGKAVIYFERVHSEVICADLTPDYTDVTGSYTAHFPHPAPPQVREGPAYFERGGKHYLITSGTTGYHPNPSEVAMANALHGPWTVLGDLHPGDRSRTSFNSQVSAVFKHPGKKDLYIALADRWIPDLPRIEGSDFASGDAYRRFEAMFSKMFAQSGAPLTKQEDALLKDQASKINTSRGTYVWLPIRFTGDRPYIEWRSKWSLDEFH